MIRVVRSAIALVLLATTIAVVAQSATAQGEPGGDGKTTILLMGGDAGPQRIGLRTDDGSQIQVDLPFDQYANLQLQIGEPVFVSPKKMRVFSPEYVI